LKAGSRDLTHGNIIREILMIAFPILFTQVFQSLYNSVDSIVVGNFVGTTALAAVTSCSDIARLLVGFFTGMSVGFGVLLSQYFGAKDYQKLRDAIHTALLFAVFLGAAMAVAGIILAPTLLELVKCPGDVYPEALQYLRIYLIGVFFTSIYNIASGVLRAVGDSRTPLYYLAAACGLNVILDLLFVTVFQMGVQGVAIATIFSQCMAVFLVFRNMLTTKDVYSVSPKELCIDRVILSRVLKLGLPAAIQNSLITFSNLFIQRYINSFGSSAMAGIGAAKKIDKYVSVVAGAIGLATAVFVAQNIGAKKYDRVRKGIWSTLAISFTGIALIGLPAYFFAPWLIRIFTADVEAIRFGEAMIKTIVPLYYAQALHQIFSNVVRGYGYSSMAMITTAIGMVVCRQIYLITAMQLDYNVHNIYTSYPVGWICSAVMSIIFYLLILRKKAKPITIIDSVGCKTFAAQKRK